MGQIGFIGFDLIIEQELVQVDHRQLHDKKEPFSCLWVTFLASLP